MNDIGIDLDDLFPIVAAGGGLFVAFVAIGGGIIQNILQTKAKEATKRELAAYVAEGSMTPADAEAILRSDMASWKKRCSS